MSTPSPQWPAELDALLATPEHHRLLLENNSVRVLETRVEPGETVKLHTHEWPAVYYVLSAGDFVRRDASGAVQVDSRTAPPAMHAGQAVWSGPMAPHTLENVGRTPIHIIGIEIKPTGAQAR